MVDYYKQFPTDKSKVSEIKRLEKENARLASLIRPEPINHVTMEIGKWSLTFDRDSCKIINNTENKEG